MKSGTREKAIKTAWISILSNSALALIKGTVGILGNSFALIADAIESFTDIFASIIVLFGIKYSTKTPDKNHPYGHGKAEPLVTFIVVGFLMVSATIIAVESIHNILTPQKAPESYTLIVLGAIIIFKELMYRLVNKRSIETESSSLKADAWHHRSDAITSLMAFIGISISIFMGSGYEAAEDYAALIASGFILYNAFLIFRPALGEIMDEHLYDDLVMQIKSFSVQVDGVIDTEKCFVRKAGMQYYVDLHVIVHSHISVKEGHMIAHNLKNELKLKLPQITDVLIHIEPDEF